MTVGDFSGDGRDDIAGRYAGEWWVGTSIGTFFSTWKWDTWTEGDWDAVFAGDVSLTPPLFRVGGSVISTRTPSIAFETAPDGETNFGSGSTVSSGSVISECQLYRHLQLD